MNLASHLCNRAVSAVAPLSPPRLRRWLERAVVAVVASLVGAHSAWADPPARVGRVNWTEGSVTLQQAPDPEHKVDAIESPRNWPVTSGDTVVTGENARTEIGVGSTLLRLGENTRIEVTRLDDEAVVVRLLEGSLALRVRNSEAGRGTEVQAGSARIEPQGAGLFRIDVRDSTLSATAWQSALRIESPANGLTLVSGQRADLDANGGGYRMSAPEIDRFASWAMNQNEPYSEVADVSPEMTGGADLNQYGDWSSHPEYGRVWAPRVVSAGWAPYRSGHWAWVRPWGWTWVDDTPWGFAPFHYGRWVQWGPRWVWAPGTWVARPTYAPAIVGWTSAPGVSVSVNFGPSVGWFPLAPREIYTPYYPCTPHYVRHVNFSHVPRIERAELYVGGVGRVVHAPPSYRYRDGWRTFDGPGHRFDGPDRRFDEPSRRFDRPGRRFGDDDRPRIISPGTTLLRPPQGQPPAALPIATLPTPSQPPRGGFPGRSFEPPPNAPTPPAAPRPGRMRPLPVPGSLNQQLIEPPPQRQPAPEVQRQPRPGFAAPAIIRPGRTDTFQQPPARLREGQHQNHHHNNPPQGDSRRGGEAQAPRQPQRGDNVPLRRMPM